MDAMTEGTPGPEIDWKATIKEWGDLVESFKSHTWRDRVASVTFNPEMYKRLELIALSGIGVDPGGELIKLNFGRWGISFRVIDSQTEPIRYWDASGNEVIPDEPEAK